MDFFKSSKNSKQKKRSKGEGGGAALMQQFGLQMPGFDGDPTMGIDDDDDDAGDLQAELKKLQQDTDSPTTKRSKAAKKNSGNSASDLQAFHKDVNKLLNDIDRPINDDELSDVDEEDLLNELKDIAGQSDNEEHDEPMETNTKQENDSAQSTPQSNQLSLLETRRDMYTKAVQTAKASGDASKTRRLDRQLKFIQELLQSARTGAPINESDIPPELFVALPPSSSRPTAVSEEIISQVPSLQTSAPSLQVENKPNNSRASIPVTTSTNNDDAIARLKSLALQAKTAGDMNKARECLIQLRALQNAGTAVPPPAVPILPPTSDNVPQDDNAAEPAIPIQAPEPRTVMEALQQRHDDLVKRHQQAVSQADNSKARRLDRLAKQYQEAIEATKRGRPYDYSELPELPGFAPIPVQQSKSQAPPPSVTPITTNAAAAVATVPSRKPSQTTTQVRGSVLEQKQQAQQRTTLPAAPIPQADYKPSNTSKDQQIQTLRLRQEEFKKRAIQAKQQDDRDTAKKYLISSKEIDKIIASIESGASVDMNSVPDLPDTNFEAIRDDEYTDELVNSDRDTIYRRLQDDLLRQMQLCARNQQMYAQMEGANNVKQANEFKILEQRCSQDLERLRKCYQHGSKPPLFHYENRQMNIIQVNNDLTDQDFEVNVVRGINLRVPSGYSSSSIETYVVIEFPFPTEAPQSARTRHGTGSTNAEYSDSLHKFQIKRNDSKLKRSWNRKELKLNIFYKAGFLRSDRQLGVASVKLAPLEQSSTLHEMADIYETEHKRKAEGKLEVKIRIREALGVTKLSEASSLKWLVIDRFEEIPHNSKPSRSKSPATTPSITAISRLVPTSESLGFVAISLANSLTRDDAVADDRQDKAVEPNDGSRRNSQLQTGPQSIQVLKYEADLIQEQIDQLEDHLTEDQTRQLRTKCEALKKQSDQIIDNLRQGGKQVVEEHLRGLEQLIERYTKEADELRKKNEIKKADILLNKKNLVAKEIETLNTPA